MLKPFGEMLLEAGELPGVKASPLRWPVCLTTARCMGRHCTQQSRTTSGSPDEAPGEGSGITCDLLSQKRFTEI